VFFGTPHKGADPMRGWRRLVCLVGWAFGVRYNKEAVKNIQPGAPSLRELDERFQLLAEGRRWGVHLFQEEVGLRRLSGKKLSALVCCSAQD
ncbi:hypothetical protein C8A05DRAFT_20435, partial [Staphylotrichum tortipilum]